MIFETSREYFELSSPSAEVFCSYLSYFAAAIVEAWSLKIPSQQIEMEFWFEKREKFLNAGYVAFIVPVCDTMIV